MGGDCASECAVDLASGEVGFGTGLECGLEVPTILGQFEIELEVAVIYRPKLPRQIIEFGKVKSCHAVDHQCAFSLIELKPV